MSNLIRLGPSATATAGATSTASAASPVGYAAVRVATTTGAVRVAVGKSPVATSTGFLVCANRPEWLAIQPGEKIAFIRDGGADVTVTYTYISR